MEGDLAGRFAIVTGAEKGIIVVFTARDEGRGKEAIRKLKLEIDASNDDGVLFHQLDVADPVSIAALVDFIKNKFGRLDILLQTNVWAKDVLGNTENLTEEKVDEVINEVLFKEKFGQFLLLLTKSQKHQ